MARLEPRKDLRNGLALCVECFGEYRPLDTSTLACGHALCLTCDPACVSPCPICPPRSAIVMCHVSGGVTGTREAPLKDTNGQVRRFATLAEAEAEARRLTHKAGRYRDSTILNTTHFEYWAEEA